jgi:hypothetical protein
MVLIVVDESRLADQSLRCCASLMAQRSSPADATADQDRVARGTNDTGLKAQDQCVGGVDRPTTGRIQRRKPPSRPCKEAGLRKTQALAIAAALLRKITAPDTSAPCT